MKMEVLFHHYPIPGKVPMRRRRVRKLTRAQSCISSARFRKYVFPVKLDHSEVIVCVKSNASGVIGLVHCVR